MEILSTDGSKTQLKPGQTRELGRAHGFDSSDKTISRRQISFFIPPFSHDQEIRVQFEVLGKNPVYVYKDNEVKAYRRFERGEMGNGEMFCVSAKNPVWYSMRKIENGAESVRRNNLESELAENLEGAFGFKGVEDLQQDGVDISDIDPVKELGFVVMGHEFDSYPKKMMVDIKNWDWFLEESRRDSEDDEDEGRKRNGSRRRKRKKGTENDDDEEWTGESEDEKVVINKSRKKQRPKYMTRSKDRESKDRSRSKSTGGKKNRVVDDEDKEDEDEDDETLGGFIVDHENVEEEEDFDEEDEEEEELGEEYDEED
ncbi:hypothetical protein CDL12_06650 [Handroanthus impetiginosus]|uniref:Uncharacterized protein n=1 Tax=Handroanthus impetiginosus TaxID=429701 RepID=A0A2G9HT16_9LAMI|nr:hypothetical protein CDL12_06650 [Handroanthus impetiginosus]